MTALLQLRSRVPEAKAEAFVGVRGRPADFSLVVPRETTAPVYVFKPNGDLLCAVFPRAVSEGAKMWGVYPVKNPYFMKQTVTFDLRYVNGTLWGSIAGDPAFNVTLDDKEDFERTLRCYASHGAVVRFNYLACDTNFYGEPGGMQEDRTPERITASAKVLVARYPDLCTLNEGKKSGHTEVRLRDRRSRA